MPAIEKYNEGRDPAFRITVTRVGGALVLAYQLKPCHNPYRIETRLLSSGPRTNPWFQECSSRKIEAGDLVGGITHGVMLLAEHAQRPRMLHAERGIY